MGFGSPGFPRVVITFLFASHRPWLGYGQVLDLRKVIL